MSYEGAVWIEEHQAWEVEAFVDGWSLDEVAHLSFADAPRRPRLAASAQTCSACSTDPPSTIREAFTLFGSVVQALTETGAAPPPILRPAVVASWLGIDEKAVRKQINLGQIPATKVGGRWVILRDEWLLQLRTSARPAEQAVA